MWPFTREVRVVVRHEIVGLDGLTRALRMQNVARRFETKVRGGLIDVGGKPEGPPPEWVAWEQANGANYEESEILHLRWCYEVLRGTEKVSDDKRLEAVNIYARAQEAGYGLPDLDGRKQPAR